MAGNNYKKYMKKNSRKKDYSLIQLFVISFFGMLLLFTILIKSFSPSVDVSIGDYKQESDYEEKTVNVDGRLTAIQDEDRGRDFADLMKRAEDIQKDFSENPATERSKLTSSAEQATNKTKTVNNNSETIYKVFIGMYTSAEQAKVAKDIIQDSNLNLNPIVKCIGSNDYTLQVGIFREKSGAESLLATIQRNHLPGRIVQED